MNDDHRLSNLLTYTTFHIGVYISLVTALIGAGVFNADISACLLRFSSGCILLAGIFGGVVGSNIPKAKSYRELEEGCLRIFGRIPMPPLNWCIHFEHFFFWLGVLPPATLFVFGGADALKLPCV